MYKGIEFDFGGKIYIVPPLNLGAIELLEEDLASFNTMSVAKQSKLALSIVFLALKRNYPEITREEVGNFIDIGNMHQVINSVCDLSGLIGSADGGQGAEGGK